MRAVVQRTKSSSVTVDGRKGTFTFAREAVRLIHDFQLGLGHVEPMTYTTALRGLTSICKRKAMA